MQRTAFLAWAIASLAVFAQAGVMADESKEVYGGWQFEKLEGLAVADTRSLDTDSESLLLAAFPRDDCSKIRYEISGQYAGSQVEAAGLLPAQIGDLFIGTESSRIVTGRAVVHEIDDEGGSFIMDIEPERLDDLTSLLLTSPQEGELHVRLEFFGQDPLVWSFPLRGSSRAVQSGYAHCE
ncbi:hypothetical protein [Thioalkalivibrio sp. ALgr3]|uniref:hypothetical protein n=1 Tax=Thioalkalivibrio sp. ALgr3 TaxID=1239292 RepID=UPI000371B1EF|nr:hypothetical protein [Thioalkalivibrio sp. ALgr3]